MCCSLPEISWRLPGCSVSPTSHNHKHYSTSITSITRSTSVLATIISTSQWCRDTPLLLDHLFAWPTLCSVGLDLQRLVIPLGCRFGRTMLAFHLWARHHQHDLQQAIDFRSTFQGQLTAMGIQMYKATRCHPSRRGRSKDQETARNTDVTGRFDRARPACSKAAGGRHLAGEEWDGKPD